MTVAWNIKNLKVISISTFFDVIFTSKERSNQGWLPGDRCMYFIRNSFSMASNFSLKKVFKIEKPIHNNS